jgi:hypothetical protein
LYLFLIHQLLSMAGHFGIHRKWILFERLNSTKMVLTMVAYFDLPMKLMKQWPSSYNYFSLSGLLIKVKGFDNVIQNLDCNRSDGKSSFLRNLKIVSCWPTETHVEIRDRETWARGVVDRAPVCHSGGPGSNLGQAKEPHSTPFHVPVSKLGGEFLDSTFGFRSYILQDCKIYFWYLEANCGLQNLNSVCRI